MKILFCDDIEKRGSETRRAIQDTTGHEVEFVCGERLKKAIGELFDHARSVLRNGMASRMATDGGPSVFGRPFDVAILDNNLSELRIAGALHTAESIAGYVRAFGEIPYVVSLNKNPQVDFDLRFLVGDHQTQADLAINDNHLSNPGLWTGNPDDSADGFLPWYWPAVNEAPDRRRQQIAFVADRLQDAILPSLDCPASAYNYLSRHAAGALSPAAKRARSVTFRRFFVTACRSLPNLRDRKRLAKAASTSKRANDVVSRVVAGELDRWIRRDLLGPQDVLVDVPHLLMRLPFLLGPQGDDLRYWNQAVSAKEPPYGLAEEVYESHLRGARFAHDVWTKGPSFWWRDLKMNTELNSMFYDGGMPWLDAVFCEDSSRFRARGGRRRLRAQGIRGGIRGFLEPSPYRVSAAKAVRAQQSACNVAGRLSVVREKAMADNLEKLMRAYGHKGMRDWKNAGDALQKTAMRCLGNRIAEHQQDVNLTVDGRHTVPQFIPMPRHGGGDFEWCFFLPKKAGGRLESLLLFILVDRKRADNCIAFRFECSPEGRHGYSHVQLTSKLSKAGLSAMGEVDARNLRDGFLPRWLPDGYPAFPVPAKDWTQMFLAMMTAVHGHQGGIDKLIRDLFGTELGTRDAQHYNKVLEKMLCKIS